MSQTFGSALGHQPTALAAFPRTSWGAFPRRPAVSQQLSTASALDEVDARTLLDAAAPVLVRIAADRGFSRLAVFGSVGRETARPDSDIDLLVEAPTDASIADVTHLRETFETVLGRPVDLVTYGGLHPTRDASILTHPRAL